MIVETLDAARPAGATRIDDAIKQAEANLQPRSTVDRSRPDGVTSPIAPDRNQIARHLDALFRHAPSGSFISFRAFFQNPRIDPPSLAIRFVRSDAPDLIRIAFDIASAAAASPEPAAFYAPHAVFKDSTSAKTANVAAALVLSVECDERPAASVRKLVDVLGPPTLLLASGGMWTNAEGIQEPKLHAHWRLAAPATAADDLARVKLTRKRMRILAESDPTCDPVVHPLRIAGGLHTKNPASPRLVRIVDCDPEREISLDAAFDAMAAALPELERPSEACAHVPEDLRGEEPDIVAALEVIPNDDLSWDAWKRVLLAVYNASGGAGVDLALAWSAKSEKHDPEVTLATWEHIASYPADHLGMATLVIEAKKAQPGWIKPSLRCNPADWFEEPRESLFPTLSEMETVASRTYSFLSLNEAAATALTASAKPLIKGILDQEALSIVYGPPNHGKSFVVFDMAYHIAAGLPWAGRRVTQGVVVMIVGEGSGGVRKRAAALVRRYGPCADFHMLTTHVNLYDPNADVRPLAAAIAQLGNVMLIGVDTVAQTMAGGDENSTRDMGQYAANLSTLRTIARSHVMGVHHTGKDVSRGARGSNSLLGAIDTEIEVMDGQIADTKQRDLEKGFRAQFALNVVELGRDADGDAITSATIDLTLHEPETYSARAPLPLRQAAVLDAMSSLHNQTINIDRLKKEMAERGDTMSSEAIRAALGRLCDTGHIIKLSRGAWAVARSNPATKHFEAPPGSLFD